MTQARILVLDDDDTIRFAISDYLSNQGYAVEEAASCSEARQAFFKFPHHAAILDYDLPDGNALQLIPEFLHQDPQAALFVLTGHGSIDLAVRAVKEGADQFLTKPVQLPTLQVMLERALENRRIKRKDMVGRTRRTRDAIDPFLGTSPKIRRLREQAERIVQSESPILVLGETGVGKGVLARWLHDHGPRREEPFVDLNCAGLSKEFLETELFGHERGAFTGAAARKQGLLEVAHRGTVFLDEIGDVDPQVQPKLLKVLEEKRFRRLGDVKDLQVDIRLIAATHQNLESKVKEGGFREDLFFRISTLPLTVPPLRERTEDIPLLVERLVQQLGLQLGRPEIRLDREAMESLQRYHWPGNIRELRNVLERGILLSQEGTLTVQDLFFGNSLESANRIGGVLSEPPDEFLTLDQMEELHIRRALERENYHVSRVSKLLQVPRSSLYQKIKKFDIDLKR